MRVLFIGCMLGLLVLAGGGFGFVEQSKPSVVIVQVDYDENMKLTKRLGEIICH